MGSRGSGPSVSLQDESGYVSREVRDGRGCWTGGAMVDGAADGGPGVGGGGARGVEPADRGVGAGGGATGRRRAGGASGGVGRADSRERSGGGDDCCACECAGGECPDGEWDGDRGQLLARGRTPGAGAGDRE